MTRFTLVVRPDGQALLTTRETLERGHLEAMREVVSTWNDGAYPVLIVPDCEVVQVESFDLDIPEPAVPH